jgi:hypothetical protein
MTTALFGQTQAPSDEPATAETQPSSAFPRPAVLDAQAVRIPKVLSVISPDGVSPRIEVNSYSTFCAYRTNGDVIANCSDSRINANSRVFAAMSEYNTQPGVDRFIGAAKMTIFNISPYNGGFKVWFNVDWANPLNVRLDFLVDP